MRPQRHDGGFDQDHVRRTAAELGSRELLKRIHALLSGAKIVNVGDESPAGDSIAAVNLKENCR
jgi:hypothetical protein